MERVSQSSVRHVPLLGDFDARALQFTDTRPCMFGDRARPPETVIPPHSSRRQRRRRLIPTTGGRRPTCPPTPPPAALGHQSANRLANCQRPVARPSSRSLLSNGVMHAFTCDSTGGWRCSLYGLGTTAGSSLTQRGAPPSFTPERPATHSMGSARHAHGARAACVLPLTRYCDLVATASPSAYRR
jgi:hypothetical protein